MKTIRLTLLCAVLMLLGVGGLGGCRSAQPKDPSTADKQPQNQRMENSMAGADAERAKAALERDQRTGERRPAVPPRPPKVDQPRPPR